MTSTNWARLDSTFVALRLATGVAAWVAPRTAADAMGLGSSQTPLSTQLFGSRELTLAVAVAASTATAMRIRALQLGLLVDALDLVAVARGVRAGTVSTRGLAITWGGAALFAGMGLAALNEKG